MCVVSHRLSTNIVDDAPYMISTVYKTFHLPRITFLKYISCELVIDLFCDLKLEVYILNCQKNNMFHLAVFTEPRE